MPLAMPLATPTQTLKLPGTPLGYHRGGVKWHGKGRTSAPNSMGQWGWPWWGGGGFGRAGLHTPGVFILFFFVI